MRTYTPRKFTPKMFRQGVVLLECPDCGVLVYERMTHDAWHAVDASPPMPTRPDPGVTEKVTRQERRIRTEGLGC